MPDRTQRAKARPRRPPQQSNSPTREVHRESTNDSRPLFSLHHLARNYGVADCDRDEKAAFADLLEDMSARTWTQLLLSSRHGTGLEKISQVSINVGLPTYVTLDVQLWSIRITQVARLIGFRDGVIFHAVWIDPKHCVYDG